MNIKKLSLSGFLLIFSTVFSASLRAVANNQAQIVDSRNYSFTSSLIMLALMAGLIGTLLAVPGRLPYGLPKDPSLPPEEDREPI